MNPLDMFIQILQNYCTYNSFEDLGLLLEGLDFDEVLPYVTAAFGEGTPEYLAFVDAAADLGDLHADLPITATRCALSGSSKNTNK